MAQGKRTNNQTGRRDSCLNRETGYHWLARRPRSLRRKQRRERSLEQAHRGSRLNNGKVTDLRLGLSWAEILSADGLPSHLPAPLCKVYLLMPEKLSPFFLHSLRSTFWNCCFHKVRKWCVLHKSSNFKNPLKCEVVCVIRIRHLFSSWNQQVENPYREYQISSDNTQRDNFHKTISIDEFKILWYEKYWSDWLIR